MDNVLIFLPVLVYVFMKTGKQGTNISKRLFNVFKGFIPFFVWEVFSIFYYGFAFPNTAYAKLGTGIGWLHYIKQGLYYLGNSISIDPITILIIIIAIYLPFLTIHKDEKYISIGICLYILYIIKIGGDFMSGRFLTVPFLASVIVLTRCLMILRLRQKVLIFSTIIVLGLVSPWSPVWSNSSYGYGLTQYEIIDHNGIADERAFYYQAAGLLKVSPNIKMPNHNWRLKGEHARKNYKVVVAYNIGFFGYYAGPSVYILDRNALSDPLLPRLPLKTNDNWRIGHFEREIPEGYLDTLLTGKNCIKNRDLAVYYDKLYHITRGNLFEGKRITQIIKMNLGCYNYLIINYSNTSKNK